MNVPGQETNASIDQTDRLCDFCNESKALLYCRADSAKLCLSCDGEVHSTNQLFKKHVRSLLCNSCNSSPSSIFCCTDSAVLCQNCDWESHKNFRSIHDRRPIEGFTGYPSVSELLSFLGLDDLGKKSSSLGGGRDDDYEFLDFLVCETPSIASLDNLIGANDCVDAGPCFQAMNIPPLPKNQNAACGKHKEEIFCQLREMAKKDPNFTGSLEDLELHAGLQSQVPGKCQLMENNPGLENNADPVLVPSYEAHTPNWSCFNGEVPDESFPSTFISSFVETNHLVPDKDLDFGESASIANTFQGVHSRARELNTQERDVAISRYKEKRKTRRGTTSTSDTNQEKPEQKLGRE
ncbi:hypothetical protein CASFOL_009998 [Castilleja foliolosa]|uniref:B box-type domain-containing protein n=1 Tax=Castilleja foliolosa TaxID=1961234 RepID=A0ABD3DR94_9LAMI